MIPLYIQIFITDMIVKQKYSLHEQTFSTLNKS